MPYTLFGLTFKSQAQACTFYNRSPRTISKWKAAGLSSPPAKSPKEIKIRGLTFRSHREASIALGFSPSHVTKMKSRNKLSSLGRGTVNAIPIKIDGKEYPSISEAVRATGIPRYLIKDVAEKDA